MPTADLCCCSTPFLKADKVVQQMQRMSMSDELWLEKLLLMPQGVIGGRQKRAAQNTGL
jgi:hypothetical protein